MLYLVKIAPLCRCAIVEFLHSARIIRTILRNKSPPVSSIKTNLKKRVRPYTDLFQLKLEPSFFAAYWVCWSTGDRLVWLQRVTPASVSAVQAVVRSTCSSHVVQFRWASVYLSKASNDGNNGMNFLLKYDRLGGG